MKVFIKTRSESGRNTVSVMLDAQAKGEKSLSADADDHVLIADVGVDDIQRLKESPDFEVYQDVQFNPFPVTSGPAEWWNRPPSPFPAAGPPPWATKTMTDVMNHIRAREAWPITRGKGVTIAVVDTGTDPTTGEFPNRSPFDVSPAFTTASADLVGHGSMCAAIACGSSETGGRYRGVAPEATLLTARSTLNAADLYLIYQHLLREKKKGSFPGGLVVSNSYGLYTCQPPEFPEGHPYVDLIRRCVAAGIVFVFAAGNNHAAGLCKYPAHDDKPNTIWAVNSIDEVISVGTVDWNESNQVSGGEHANSSRGPGQWSTLRNKPDVVAPTYGEVVWGGGYQNMEWWGTSGACPQVAGLAALMLAKNPALSPAEIKQKIGDSARKLPAPAACVGRGIIDCVGALSIA
jgi:subtilisin family serine protease